MFALAINTFEVVWAWIAFRSFKSRGIGLKVSFITPCCNMAGLPAPNQLC